MRRVESKECKDDHQPSWSRQAGNLKSRKSCLRSMKPHSRGEDYGGIYKKTKIGTTPAAELSRAS